MQQGVQAGTAMQAYSLLQEKIQKLRQMGEEAFDQGELHFGNPRPTEQPAAQ